MGGSAWDFEGADLLKRAAEVTFVVFAGTPAIERRENVILLPVHSPVFVPDLIAASDVIVGKLGYSTVAEAWSTGCRYMFVPRPAFPESPYLATFVREHLPSRELELAAFESGAWIDLLEPLLARAPAAGSDRQRSGPHRERARATTRLDGRRYQPSPPTSPAPGPSAGAVWPEIQEPAAAAAAPAGAGFAVEAEDSALVTDLVDRLEARERRPVGSGELGAVRSRSG